MQIAAEFNLSHVLQSVVAQANHQKQKAQLFLALSLPLALFRRQGTLEIARTS